MLEEQGAAGDICGRLYDIHGEKLVVPVDRRIIGIELDDLRQIKHVVGVAGGEKKAKAIFGALSGKRVTALVTDDMAARQVLRMADEI
jgi:DNA-binding transcriptional regulator LsrR (DeoR family)